MKKPYAMSPICSRKSRLKRQLKSLKHAGELRERSRWSVWSILEPRNNRNTDLSLAEMLFCKGTRSLLFIFKLQRERIHRRVKRKSCKTKYTVKINYDRRACDLQNLQSGHCIYYHKWEMTNGNPERLSTKQIAHIKCKVQITYFIDGTKKY